MIVEDASQDMDPSGYPQLGLPVHQVGIVAMELWLIDAVNCEELVEVCQRLTGGSSCSLRLHLRSRAAPVLP